MAGTLTPYADPPSRYLNSALSSGREESRKVGGYDPPCTCASASAGGLGS
jgi:hypothetical protein